MELERAARLDVIVALDAHQRNVEPRPAETRAALVALPAPPICRLLAPLMFEAARARSLEEMAVELGGGDGPLPIIDLAASGEPLSSCLEGLWVRGVRSIYVHGTREQPGYARALRYRWPGAVDELPSHRTIDALLDPRDAVRWLAAGIACTAPYAPLPAEAECVLVAVDDDVDPQALRQSDPRTWPYAPDPERRLAPWSGVVSPSAAFGTPRGARIRARWDAYWSAAGRPDLVRAAVLGLDGELEAALRARSEVGAVRTAGREPDAAGEASRARARVIAITGIDGSGKTSHAARFAQTVHARGARVHVLKLYRQGAFLELANELSGRTRRGAPLACFRASRIVKLLDSLRVYRDHMLPSLSAADVLVMDRYIETHIAAAASQLGWEISRHPALSPFPRADARFWLSIDPELALRRRSERPSADEHAVGLLGYAREFARMATEECEVRLDASSAEEENARTIAERSALVLGTFHGPARDSSLTPPAAPPTAAAAFLRPCRLQIGPAEATSANATEVPPELGAEALSLRAALGRWCPESGAAMPEAFWLEAYAAEVVLDQRKLAPERARVALWPGALAAMHGHGDLPMLLEFERLLLARAEVETYGALAADYVPSFVALGALRPAAERLARDYAVQLRRIARDRGWPCADHR